MLNVKLVVVGNTGVGKTCMLVSYTSNAFPTDYIPTVFDNMNHGIMVDDKYVGVGLWDTAGSDDYDRLRPLTYPQTDIFLLCFAINSRESFNNITKKWITEVRHHCPKEPIILVGTKIDLRDCPVNQLGEVHDLGSDPVTTEEGEELSRQIGALTYLECSALTQQYLNLVFTTAIRAAINPSAVQPPVPRPPPKPVSPVVSPMPFSDARFASLVNNKQFSDVTFRVQQKELYAHKVVLSASSPMFQKMLMNESSELPPIFARTTKATSNTSETTDIVDWKQEEHVTIDVKDFSYEAFLVVLNSCYTVSAPSAEETSNSHVTEAVTFFQRYPRFTSDERKKFLMSLAESDTNNNNNNNDNTAVPRFADVCIELPSKRREYCHKVILVAGSDHFGMLLMDSEPNNTIKVDMSDFTLEGTELFGSQTEKLICDLKNLRTRKKRTRNSKFNRIIIRTTMKSVKCVLVGDSNVGKTCMLISYTAGAFPGDYIPPIMDAYNANKIFDGRPVNLTLLDTAAGTDDFAKRRRLSYPQTDVFIICFAVDLSTSFSSIKRKWIPEIKHHCPNTPFIIVGNRVDIRERGQQEGEMYDPISTELGEKLALEVGAVKYLECSALTQQGLYELFDTAVKCVIDSSSKSRCIIL